MGVDIQRKFLNNACRCGWKEVIIRQGIVYLPMMEEEYLKQR